MLDSNWYQGATDTFLTVPKKSSHLVHHYVTRQNSLKNTTVSTNKPTQPPSVSHLCPTTCQIWHFWVWLKGICYMGKTNWQDVWIFIVSVNPWILNHNARTVIWFLGEPLYQFIIYFGTTQWFPKFPIKLWITLSLNLCLFFHGFLHEMAALERIC